MEEILFMAGKLIVSSTLLYAFYWLVLRNRASYTLARLYLLLMPFVSLTMSGLTFEVYTPKATTWHAEAPAPPVAVEPTDHAPVVHTAQSQQQTAAAPTTEAATTAEWAIDSETAFQLFVLLCGVVSVGLLLTAAYNFIKFSRLSRRLKGERTAEGYQFIRSAEVSTPCSFLRTIFMPIGFSYDQEQLVLRHEKAHIAHAHFVDVWVMTLMTYLLWFNPVLWLARNELRNVHEFEADQDVLATGTDMNVYQTLLLAQVIDNGTAYANGFNHSFIRRRFVEMKRSTAGTLGRLGKAGIAAWVVLLFCGFTFSEGKVKLSEAEKLSRLELSKPQIFTIEGTVGDSTSYIFASILLADDYLEFPDLQEGDSTPVAFISDKHFSYSIPLKRMTAGRIRFITPEGHIDDTPWIDLFFVPGETVSLNVHNNSNITMGFDDTDNYFRKIRRGVNALREATGWQSPHLPKLSGKKWENVTGENTDESQLYPYLKVKEIIFGKDETYVRLYDNGIEQDALSAVGKDAYLLDEKGKKYAMKRPVYGNITDDKRNDLATSVFGCYYAFEPVPDNVKELTFIDPVIGKTKGKEPIFRHAIAHIKKAEQQKPNFQVDVRVTQGINDSGYIVELYDNPYRQYNKQIIAEIPTDNRHCTFTTHLDKLLMGQFTATFPDGSICTHCIRFPFVPGEHAELKVMNGFFNLTGSKFYKDWGAANELVENASQFKKPGETYALIKDYLAKHANEEGCVMFYLQNHILPVETIKAAMPTDMLTGRFRDIMKMWYDVEE